LKNGSRIQQAQPISYAGKYSGIHDDLQTPEPQYDADHGHGRLDNSYYNSPSPRFPTLYHIGGSLTTFNPSYSQDNFSEEEYDPWTFSKTHGYQAGNHTVTKPHRQEYSFYQAENNGNSGWHSESYYRTSFGFQSEPGRNQDQTYRPRSQWNRQGTSVKPIPDPGMLSNTYIGDRKFRNENQQGNQRVYGSFSGPYTDHSFAYNNKNSQDDQRTVRGYSRSDSSYVTQGMVGSHHRSNSNWSFHYTENLPVTHSTVGNYPSSGGNWGLSYSENPQVTQTTLGSYSGSKKDQGFSHNEHIFPNGYSGSDRNQGFSHNEYRSPSGYSESSRNQGFSYSERISPRGYSGSRRDWNFSHNEHRSPSDYSGSYRDQGFSHSKNSQTTQRNGESYTDHPVTQVFSSSEESGAQRNHRTSTESYVKHGASPDIRGSYGEDIHNTRKHMFHTKEQSYDTVSPNPGLNKKPYPSRRTEVRGQDSNVNERFHGQHHAIPHDMSSTDRWEERSVSKTQQNPNVNTQTFKETVSQHREWEGPRSILQPHPVQLLPTPVQRPRYGDRPSAVPRTATPFKREGSPLTDDHCVACFRMSYSTMHYDALCLHILSCFLMSNPTFHQFRFIGHIRN
jgi:hypothetical protein